MSCPRAAESRSAARGLCLLESFTLCKQLQLQLHRGDQNLTLHRRCHNRLFTTQTESSSHS